ncbi:MAG: urease accessory protein UreE, partial [Bryobacteraceae bacterium]
AEVRCNDPEHLIRVAWHLGNRHLPTQIMAKSLRIRRDHVIEAMVTGMGARVIGIEAPFDPEGGAYAEASHAHAPEAGSSQHATHDHSSHDHSSRGHGEHHHDHDHHHDEHCDHDHGHGHSHAHEHK